MSRRILANLKGGDVRSIGQSDDVVQRVREHPQLFGELFEGLLDEDRLVRMRAADAVEKLTREQPELLKPWKQCLLHRVANRQEKEMRWHVAQLLPRLTLSSAEKELTLSILSEYLRDPSSIVRTFTMQALVDLAADDSNMRGEIRPLIEQLTRTGTPAMKARGRKLTAKMDKGL
jgi:hypothetical protein